MRLAIGAANGFPATGEQLLTERLTSSFALESLAFLTIFRWTYQALACSQFLTVDWKA